MVPYRTLHRFCEQCCGFTGRRPSETVRVADGDPGMECQIDFGEVGLLFDPAAARRRRTQALVFTAVYSRHKFVWLTHSQTLDAVIAGCEAAWTFFGGVFKVMIPDNMKAIVAKADAVNPLLTRGWLDYAQHCGFVTDTARVRTPTDKPRVERVIQYVRTNFWAGESFVDLADAQARAVTWCTIRAGLRVHGTTQARPAEVFAQRGAVGAASGAGAPTTCRVQAVQGPPRLPYRGRQIALLDPERLHRTVVDVRVDSALVKVSFRGKVVKVHPRQPPGQAVDRPGRPARAQDRLRDAGPGPAGRRRAAPRRAGGHLRPTATRRSPLPWTRMRAVYRLLGLARRYGDDAVNAACARALEFDVVNVTKIALDAGTRRRDRTATVTAPGRHRGRPVRARPGRVRRRPRSSAPGPQRRRAARAARAARRDGQEAR